MPSALTQSRDASAGEGQHGCEGQQELSEMECQLPEPGHRHNDPPSSLPDVGSGKVQAKLKPPVCLEKDAF